MEVETWRLVGGYPYEVSSLGNVRRVGGHSLRPRRHSNGYQRVSLGAGNDSYVHRLVCEAFHGAPPAAGYEVDHIDNDRTNNSAANLRWLTVADNRARRLVRRGSGHSNAKLTERDVVVIRASNARTAELAAAYSVAPRTIRDARSGKLWRHVNA